MYNHSMGGVDIVVKRAASYHLDCKSSMRFYLRIFFLRFHRCILHQRLHRLQCDAPKLPYPA